MIVTVGLVKTFCLYYEKWLESLHNTYLFIFLICFKRVGSVLSSPELHVVPSFLMWYYALMEKGP